jgi:hypothetical protein
MIVLVSEGKIILLYQKFFDVFLENLSLHSDVVDRSDLFIESIDGFAILMMLLLRYYLPTGKDTIIDSLTNALNLLSTQSLWCWLKRTQKTNIKIAQGRNNNFWNSPLSTLLAPSLMRSSVKMRNLFELLKGTKREVSDGSIIRLRNTKVESRDVILNRKY